jgi:hypothetical protein
VGHHRPKQGICEDDAVEVKNAMLRMALIGENDYDTTNAVTEKTGEPTETGQPQRKLKKQ